MSGLSGCGFLSRVDFPCRDYLAGSGCAKGKIADRWDFVLILLVAVLMIYAAWVGYVGTDDQSYARGALGWLNRFPYVGDNHWELRHPLVVPLAVSLGLFGYREISLGLPSAVFFLLLLVMNHYYLRRFFGKQVALIASLFTATTPLFAVYATFPQTVVVETLAMSLSFWLFYSATREQRCGWLMFTSGVAAGVAFLLRETAGVLGLFYGILFVIGFGVPRRYYWLILTGFLLVVGTEVLYLTAMTGDPLYRYRIDLFHEGTWSNVASPLTVSVVDDQGNLAVKNLFIDRLLVLLLNQEFGLLFWAFVPAAIWGCYSVNVPVEDKRLLRLLTGLSVLWILAISFGRVLAPVPRFYTTSVWAAVIIVVLWLRYFFYVYRPKLAMGVAASLLTVNLLCIYVENREPALAERALVMYVTQHSSTVYTDPTTLRYAKLLLEFKGVSGRVVSDPVPAGGLFYSNVKNIESCKRYGCRYRWEEYIPKEGWTEVMSSVPAPRYAAPVIRSLGLDKLIPRDILDRIEKPNTGGVLYLASPSKP